MSDIKPIRYSNIYSPNFGKGYTGNVWFVTSVSPTLQTMLGGNRTPLVLVEVSDDRIKIIGEKQ